MSKRSPEEARERKRKIVEYLGGSCERCGYDACNAALHCHHRNPSVNKFSPSQHPRWSWETIAQELEKCVLLCANCHFEHHAGVWELPKVKRRIFS